MIRVIDLPNSSADEADVDAAVPVRDNVERRRGSGFGINGIAAASNASGMQGWSEPEAVAASQVNPPVVKGGSGGMLNGVSERDVDAHFDWYAATIDANPALVVDRLAAALGADARPAKGRFGYTEAVELVKASATIATVLAGGIYSKPYAWASGQDSEEFAAVLRREWSGAHAVARMDSRIDFVGEGTDSHTWDILFNAVVEFAKSRGLTTSIQGDYLDGGKAGRTLYVGSRKSMVFLRLYEKSQEIQARSRTRSGAVARDWVRVEIELKPRKVARDHAATATARDAWGYAKWTRDLLSELTGLDVPRTQIAEWRQSDDERSFEWLAQQYGPTLQRMAAAEGWDSVLSRLERAVFADEPHKP